MMGIRSWLVVVALVAVAFPARGDTVRLVNGREVEGRLTADSYTISTVAQGDLVIPVDSIRALRFSEGDGVTVELVNGQELQGRFVGSEIVLGQELFSNTFDPADVAEVLVEPREKLATVPQGSRIRLMLAEWLSSKSAQMGQEVTFCVAEELQIKGEGVIPRGAPAVGEITAARGAAKMSQRGELALEPRYVVEPGGRRIPVAGSGGFAGGLNPGNFIAAGVLGFVASGEEVVVPAGTAFNVVTEAEAEAAVGADRPDSELWHHCREFFRFADAELVPLEAVDLNGVYAPFGTSLTAELPLTEFQREGRVNRSLRNLLTFDTYIQSLIVATDPGRNRVELDVTLVLVVLPSHDKRVNLRVAVLDGGEVLAEEKRSNVDAEEEKSKLVRMTVKVDGDRFEEAVSSAEGRLRIDMHVRE